MITPTIEFVDSIINHPSVRPTAQEGDYKLSAAKAFANGARAVVCQTGVILFMPIGWGTWEGHIFMLEASRGATALAFGRQALSRFFAYPDASRLRAAVPLQLPAARMYCRRLGLRAVAKDPLYERFELEAAEWAE